MTENSEQNWVKCAQRGEPEAIAELYKHYWRAARASAYRITGDLSMAEDAASEAFCTALERLPDLRDTERFGPWLHTIVVRTAHHIIKNQTRQQRRERSCPALGMVSHMEDRLEQPELAVLIQEAIGSLPQTLCEAISLFYFEGYKLSEGARFLDIPIRTLKRRLYEGHQRLRETAKQVLEGRKPMNSEREKIL